MSKKVIIFARNLDLFKKFYSNLNYKTKKKIEVSQIYTKQKYNSIENKKFFKCHQIKNYIEDANIDEINSKEKYFINDKILLKFQEVEKKFNYMLDFYESDAFPYKNVEKRSLYYSYLNKLINFFQNNEFDYIFFSHNPHDLIEVMILEIAKILKIKCIYIRGFPLINYYKFDNNFRELKEKKITSKELTLNNIKKITKNFNILKRENKKVQNYFLIKSNIVKLNYLNITFYLFYIFAFLSYFFNILKISIKVLFFNQNFLMDNYVKFKEEKKITKFNFEQILLKNNIKKFELLKQVYKNSKKINYKENYVYFPLWFQPSSTSYPFCGDYINYEILINMVHEVLPKNFNLIIKDSPDIFNLNRNAWFRGPFVRKENFYKNISAKTKVFLADQNEPDDKLIKNAEMVCGLPDLSLLSSYYNKKKIIIFGDALFPLTHGVKFCSNKVNLKAAIKHHLSSRDISTKDLNSFTDKLNNKLFYNNFNEFIDKKKMNYKRIAQLFEKQFI